MLISFRSHSGTDVRASRIRVDSVAAGAPHRHVFLDLDKSFSYTHVSTAGTARSESPLAAPEGMRWLMSLTYSSDEP